jgi:prepilin-type N-terminal cleavage/methylation domain-containing protein
MLEAHALVGPVMRRRRLQAGFSLAELLAVLAIIGAIVAMGIPLINEQVRIAEARSISDQIAVHLRAARMIAVTQHKDVDVTISVDPTNTVSYTGANGELRLIAMPPRVKIKSGSSVLIRFKSDGSANATGTLTTESAVANAIERWTLTVNTVGMVSVAHVRV